MLDFCTVSILMRSVNNCFGIIRTSAIETVQETLARSRYWRKTLAGLWVLLDSCFRDCAKNLVRLRWWKTQPPKSPLSGGLSTQFPPDKGG